MLNRNFHDAMNGYFDHNATTPLSASAREAWLAAQSGHWQNPSGLYREAGATRQRLEEAREAFAEILGCEARRIVFNSGATEGCNAVMARAAREAAADAPVFISEIEHPAVRESARKEFGRARVGELPVDSCGVVDLDLAQRMIAESTPALVSVMAANNETGVLQPWRALAEICREHGARFHCDAAQWIGKMPADGFEHCDWVSFSAHKFGGPKGIGVLVVPDDACDPLALLVGGAQESGHRGGTENFPAVAAMLAALQARGGEIDAAGRDAFETGLAESIPGTRIIGADAQRLPNTSMALMPAHGNLKWLTRLSERGFAVSTGSACSAGHGNPSHVMAAMGLSPDEMGRVLRFSGGPETTPGDWEGLASALLEIHVALQDRRRSATKLDLSNL